MMSSVMPSASRPVLSSPPILVNGKTAINDLTFRGSDDQNCKPTAAASPSTSNAERTTVATPSFRHRRACTSRTRHGDDASASRRTRYVRMARAMFLTCCSPAKSTAMSSLPCRLSKAMPEISTPLGLASCWSRAATFTPSPKTLSFSTRTSPTLMPIRKGRWRG